MVLCPPAQHSQLQPLVWRLRPAHVSPALPLRQQAAPPVQHTHFSTSPTSPIDLARAALQLPNFHSLTFMSLIAAFMSLSYSTIAFGGSLNTGQQTHTSERSSRLPFWCLLLLKQFCRPQLRGVRCCLDCSPRHVPSRSRGLSAAVPRLCCQRWLRVLHQMRQLASLSQHLVKPSLAGQGLGHLGLASVSDWIASHAEFVLLWL